MAVFVGRDSELQRLKRRLAEAEAGKGRVVFISGEAGAGKSSLVSQLVVEAALQAPQARIIGAACSEQYGAGEPYQPFVEAFKDLLQEPERPTSSWRNLREIAAEVAPHWLSAIPLAGGIISATMSTAQELRKMGGVATAAPNEEALFFQYTELFFAAAAQSPILLFIDDLHWADRATVSLLTHLARRIGKERVLIIGTYRAADVDVTKHPIREARLELERYGVAEELALEPLGRESLRALVTEELGAPPTPELLAWLERQAGTNPLFFVELLRWLVEHGHAKEQYGAWGLTRVLDGLEEVPRSAESAIERRLARLDPEMVKILEYASVEGNEFGSTTLAMLLGVDELELEESMEPLVRLHRLVRLVDTRELPAGDLTSIYQFTHSLIQDVLQKNLQGKRRILLHRKMAEILEKVHAGATEAIAHRLAVHFDEGRQRERAYEFAVIGADHASSVFAYHEAIGLIRRALRNAVSDAQRAAALERLGEWSHLIGRFADALQAYEEGAGALRASGEQEGEIRVRRKILLAEGAHGGLPRDEMQQQLLELAEQCRRIQARRELCEIIWLLNVVDPAGSGDAAVGRAQDALRTCEGLDDPELLAKAHFSLAQILAGSGSPADGVAHLRKAIELLRANDNGYKTGGCLNALGVLYALLGDYKAAARELGSAAEIFDKLGMPAGESEVRNNLGALLTRLGKWDEAEENLKESIRLARRMEATTLLMNPLENMARLQYVRRDWSGSREHWQALLERATETGYSDARAVAICGIGLTHLEEGQVELAREQERRAQEILIDQKVWSDGRTEYNILAARLAHALGETAGALHFLETAEQALAARDRFLWASIRLLKGEIIGETDARTAAEIIGSAQAAFQGFGAEEMVRRATASLDSLKES